MKDLHSKESANNYLADGHLRCLYAEIPSILKVIDRYLLDQGVEYSENLAVECINSVPGALLLILLLQKRTAFVILPHSEKKETDTALKQIPRFCRYRIRVKPIRNEDSTGVFSRPENFLAVERLSAEFRGCQPPESLEKSDNIFFCTSGSMGKSKIVVNSHANVVGNAQNCLRKYQFTADDRIFLPIPISHSYAFGTGFLAGFLAGASLFFLERSNILNYLDSERSFQPTVALVTPTLCEMVLQGKTSRRPYKVIVTSGQRIRPEVFKSFNALCGDRLVNQYGSTEMGAIASCYPHDPRELRGATIGYPMEGVQLKVQKTEDQKDELYCRHPYGFSGYMDDEGHWTSRAREWHGTGDIVTIRDGGFMEIRGRTENSINRCGYLVLLSDIENEIQKLEFLVQVAVVATQSEGPQGQKLVACCVCKEGYLLNDSQVRAAISKILPNYAVPEDVLFLKTLPLLPNGKVDLQTLGNWAEDKISKSTH